MPTRLARLLGRGRYEPPVMGAGRGRCNGVDRSPSDTEHGLAACRRMTIVYLPGARRPTPRRQGGA